MSTAVIAKSIVFSFPVDPSGVGYVWAEESYDTKDEPSDAQWNVMAVGTRPAIVDRIFTVARNIAGGSTVVGRKSPQAYISEMLKKLERPNQIGSTIVSLQDKGKFQCIFDSNREMMSTALQAHGLISQNDALLSGESFCLDISAHMPVIEKITGPGGISPWKLFPELPWPHMRYGIGVTEANVSQSRKKYKVDLMKLPIDGHSHHDEVWLCSVDGVPAVIDKIWAVKSRLIGIARDLEATTPGAYKHLLNAFDAAELCPALYKPNTQIRIDARLSGQRQGKRALELSVMLFGEERDTFDTTVEEAQKAIQQASPESLNSEKYVSYLYSLRCLVCDQEVTSVLNCSNDETDSPETMTFARPRSR